MTEIDLTTDPTARTRKRPRGRPGRFNWGAMKVGDKIVVPEYKTNSLLSSALQYAKLHGLDWKFKARNLPDKGAEVVRIK